MARNVFQKYTFDSTESANRITTFQVGTLDINLVAYYIPADIPVAQAGFPLWVVAVAGGSLGVFYLINRRKGGRRK